MTGVEALVGTAVRDREGRAGRVANAGVLRITLSWSVPGSLMPRTEELLRSDSRLGVLEALTLDRGWVSLRSLAGARRVSEGKHSPYQYQRTLGPGPKGREVEKKNRFVCVRAGKWKQSCIDRSKPGVKRKTIQLKTSIARTAKTAYQKAYRQWAKKQGAAGAAEG